MGISGDLKTLGPATTLSYAAARAATATRLFGWHRYILISVPADAMPAMPRGHSARTIDAAALSGHVIDAPPAVQSARFTAGLACIAAFAGDELIGVNWLARGHHDEDELRVRYLLPDDAAWDTGLWIRPEKRLGRGFAALWAGTAAWLAAQGLRRSMSRIADYNSGSLNAHRRMRSVEIGRLSVLDVAGMQVAAGATPMFTARTVPVVDLRAR